MLVVVLVFAVIRIVIWPHFGRITHPGSLVEAVGVPVHLSWYRCP